MKIAFSTLGCPNCSWRDVLVMAKDLGMDGIEIREYVMSHMAKHKTPKYVSFVTSFPMNNAGKISKYKRYKMREEAVRLLGLQGAKSIETA